MEINLRHSWERFARQASRWTGRPEAFAIALAIILVWLATGPIFRYSDTWQLIINTGTAVEGASNSLIDVEELTEEELDVLQDHYRKLVAMARREAALKTSHSIEEAEARHQTKRHAVRKR